MTRKQILKIVGTVAVLGIVLVTLRDKLPEPAHIADALNGADVRWLMVAALAEFVSMAMFGRQQRRLLLAFGVSMPRHRALALSYSRSAISISLPAGSAVSAGYAFRQFLAGGADKAAATAVMLISGLLSFLGLLLLYATGTLVHLSSAWQTHPVPTAAATIAGLAVLGWAAYSLSHTRERHWTPSGRWSWLEPLVNTWQTARAVAPRHWALALGSAVINWLTDLLCLLAAARAFDIQVSVAQLAAVYLTVQIVRQIPLTPGGIGVIEVSLLAGLVSAGADETAAAAAVLAYRLLSCWLIIPFGLLGWLVLRQSQRSQLVDGTLLDDDGLGEDTERLAQHDVAIGPRRDVGEQQPSGARAKCQLPRLLPRKVHPRRPVRLVRPRRFRKQYVDAAGQLVERLARPGVTRVGDRGAVVGQPDAERRGRVVDLDGASLERADLHGLTR
jgi:uncharacterized membrane protein YbhN (UPF0104 family)